MKTTGMFWMLALTFVLAIACGSETTTEPTTEEPTTNTEVEPTTEEPTEQPAADGPQSLEGTLAGFDESGIPMLWVVTVKGADGTEGVYNFEVSFEEANKYMEAIGKSVTVNYTSSTKPALIDILTEGQSIMGEYSSYVQNGNKVGADWIELVGTLDAPAATEGDMPDLFTIAKSNGEKVEMEYFITPEMVALNGKEITAYYIDHTTNIATTIEIK